MLAEIPWELGMEMGRSGLTTSEFMTKRVHDYILGYGRETYLCLLSSVGDIPREIDTPGYHRVAVQWESRGSTPRLFTPRGTSPEVSRWLPGLLSLALVWHTHPPLLCFSHLMSRRSPLRGRCRSGDSRSSHDPRRMPHARDTTGG